LRILNVFLGIPFDIIPFRLEIAELAQNLLGDNLIALQAGNEPDLYGRCVPASFVLDLRQLKDLSQSS